MQYNFNGTIIELKDRVCQLWDYIPGEIDPQINLYVRVANNCNAACKFCEYHGEKTEFDLITFEKALRELRERNILDKIQITGGEPSILGTKLIEILKLIRKYFPYNFISINTNGYNLDTLLAANDYVDNFAISRHHYDETINKQLFGCNTVPTQQKLRGFIEAVGSEKIHFSCNLLKSGIGNKEEMKRYLEFCSSLNCNDIGFVTLMVANEFCSNEQVIFDYTGIDDDTEVLKHKQYVKAGNCCRCANYLYFCKNTGKLIDFYARFVSNKDESTGILVYDHNTLRYGFSGESIKL